MMYLHSSSLEVYDRKVCYHDKEIAEDLQSWREEVGHVVPSHYGTIPQVVAEYSDKSLEFIGGVDHFVKKFGCPPRD